MKYWKSKSGEYKDIEIYLLRNYPFSGIGFQLQWSGFYPDFIMWLKNKNKQIIVFIDPKGLEHTKGLDDEKIQFSQEIKNIEKEIFKNNKNIILESFVFSPNSFNDLIKNRKSSLSKEDYINYHVLFFEDKDCFQKFFDILKIKI